MNTRNVPDEISGTWRWYIDRKWAWNIRHTGNLSEHENGSRNKVPPRVRKSSRPQMAGDKWHKRSNWDAIGRPRMKYSYPWWVWSIQHILGQTSHYNSLCKKPDRLFHDNRHRQKACCSRNRQNVQGANYDLRPKYICPGWHRCNGHIWEKTESGSRFRKKAGLLVRRNFVFRVPEIWKRNIFLYSWMVDCYF